MDGKIGIGTTGLLSIGKVGIGITGILSFGKVGIEMNGILSCGRVGIEINEILSLKELELRWLEYCHLKELELNIGNMVILNWKHCILAYEHDKIIPMGTVLSSCNMDDIKYIGQCTNVKMLAVILQIVCPIINCGSFCCNYFIWVAIYYII